MAVTKITPTKMVLMNTEYATPAATLVGADGMEIDFTGVDMRTLIMVDSTAGVTIKAGNGIQGVADLEVAAGKSVVLESGAFKFVSGVHKGKVFITGATAKVSAIELP